jgi:hypothetical protein
LFALESGEDGDTADALLCPALNALTLRRQTGDGGAGTFGLAQRGGYRLVRWHNASNVKPMVLCAQLTQSSRRAPAHDAGRRNLAV